MTPPQTSVVPVPMPNQQQPMPGYSAFSAYAPPLFPHSEINQLRQQIPPEIYDMYMKLNTAGGMPPGLPGIPADPMPMVQAPIPMPSSTAPSQQVDDSGTISPVQQQQQTQSNCSPVAVSPPVPGVPNPSQQNNFTPTHMNQMMLHQGLATASPYAMNNILGGSVSANTSPTNPGSEEEKENGSKRRNTFPTSSAKRLCLYEPAPMVPNMMMLKMLMGQRADACVICGDYATGYHYKTKSCEGCKGFFRRSVPREVHEKYVCTQKGKCQFTLENCTLNRNIRNRCKACRFRRCLEMGMSKESVRQSDKGIKKETHGSMENLSPTVEALVSHFQSLMSTRERIASKTHAEDCIRSLLQNATVFSGIGDTEKLIGRILPGLMTLRAAFTLDTLPFFTSDNAHVAELIEKIRSGIRNTILFDEGLAILSGIFIFQFTNGGCGETYESFYNGLRQHFNATQSQDSGTAERLLTKLGLLL